jgi:hypothetical protein
LTPCFFCCCSWMIDLLSNSRHLLIATVQATGNVRNSDEIWSNLHTNNRERDWKLDYLRHRRSRRDAWVWVREDQRILRRSCIRRRWVVLSHFSVTSLFGFNFHFKPCLELEMQLHVSA